MLRHSLRSSASALQQRASPVAARALSSSAANAEYDYVIVGGGSAGCVLANRLTEDPNNKVLLVETGPDDRTKWDSWKIHMPAALTYNLANDKYNWYYFTEPQKHLNNRRLPWPRGRVLGEPRAGPDDYRGGDGPLHVIRGNQKDQVLFKKFIDAGVQAGYPFTEDMNGYQQEGFGWMDMTVWKGFRWSTASAYLRPAMKRPNLTVVTDTFVSKVVFEGKKAVGVETENRKNKTTKQVRAAKEVILSGGAINSPQLLMLSGIGDADHLKEVGVPVVQHLPAVGQNMEDHLDLYVQYMCKKPITLHNATWKYPHKMVAIGLEWIFRQTGMGASSHLESGGFIRSAPGKRHPDLQYHFLPGSLTGQLTPGAYHAMQAHCSPMRAQSRGWLKLRSNNPHEHPIIEPNYLSEEQDLVDMRNGVKLTREILEQQTLDEYRGDPISPSKDVQTDAQIDEWIRQHTESAYHPSCTNRMGVDENTVVDPQTRVHGVENLRVVDASIMPNIVSGNLNAPTIMIAEKAADIILGKTPLPKSTAPVYQPKNWETSQR
ncbi:hypothetical protein AM588_10005293 [Phytophthora nicotianae]|uniref:Glucose-methanol-choline oxidoreductase N-terminal domain-containing protein n=1 Tax=Phytophthora nicotianae TaxID=4792 RepID=A0A0W8DF24_PHYNI|nr:hypothetical protein AM588_10005293 [Phytophthora nicotianae]